MLPDNTASSYSIGGVFLPPDDRVTSPLVDWERGGIDLQDPDQGLNVRNWRLYYENASDVMIQPEGGDATLVFTQVGIVELALAFDQAMRPHVAYRILDNIYLRWFDTVANAYVVENFGVGKNPKLALDDKRPSQSANSDIIFAFIQNGELAYRQQRDRYMIKRALKTGLEPTVQLKAIGMTDMLRMQFELT